MYDYLKGALAEKMPTAVTLDVNGVGFRLMIPLSTSQKLPDAGKTVKLLVHHHVREDTQLLFGFATEEERSLFRLLIGVSGIGAKLAITVLSGLGTPALKQAIVNGAISAITAVPGIGRKTAERLVVELREKIVLEAYSGESKAAVPGGPDQALVEDSLKALISLGYSKQNARTAIQKVLGERKENAWRPETLIRESLKHM